MKPKCQKCSKEVNRAELDYRNRCPDCKRRDDDEDDRSRRSSNIAMGDMFGTGMIGGMDGNITTPW